MMFGNKNKKEGRFSALPENKLHKDLDFLALEQYKLLRTNLLFTLEEDVKCPVIGITSSIRGEGKSTTAINLSYVIAEGGCKTLLIDGDFRLPSVAKKMKTESVPGLSDLLLSELYDIEGFKSPLNDNWYILPSGKIPPNPSELLGSLRMSKQIESFRGQFDYIIIDLPPINLVSDALTASRYIDGMILVVRENYVAKKDLEECTRQMELSRIKLLGCVMNDNKDGANFHSKYGKYKKYKNYRYLNYEKIRKEEKP